MLHSAFRQHHKFSGELRLGFMGVLSVLRCFRRFPRCFGRFIGSPVSFKMASEGFHRRFKEFICISERYMTFGRCFRRLGRFSG